MTSKVIQGHMRPLLCQNHSSTFVYEPILIEICMNVSIIKTHFFLLINVTFMLWRSFTLRPSDLITTLTYVLMDNFCPCFNFKFQANLQSFRRGRSVRGKTTKTKLSRLMSNSSLLLKKSCRKKHLRQLLLEISLRELLK